MAETLTFIQISDTHIDASCESIAGVRPASILSRAIEDINDSFPHASFVVHTGDVANDGTEADYGLYRTLITSLKAPMHHLRGGHDHDAGLFSNACSEGTSLSLHWNFRLGGWHFVGLDSGAACGDVKHSVSSAEMTWLRQLMLDNPDCPTVLFLHCHFRPANSDFIDAHMMCNADEFLSELSLHKCIRFVAIGHLHHPLLSVSEYAVISAPSLSWQFPPMARSLAYDDVPPGYRVFEIDGAGSVFTFVRRLAAVPRNECPVQLG